MVRWTREQESKEQKMANCHFSICTSKQHWRLGACVRVAALLLQRQAAWRPFVRQLLARPPVKWPEFMTDMLIGGPM